MGQIRGAAVVSTMEYVMFKNGKEVYKRVLGHLDPRQQKLFRKRMDDHDWIELDDFIDFNLAIVREVYDGDKKKLEELGAESAEYGVNSFVKFFIKFGSVSFLLKKSTAAFSGYYTSGRVIMDEETKNSVKFLVVNVPDRENVIAFRVKGFIGRIVELVGPKVTELTLDITDNDHSFKIFVKWE